jgi:NAD(P)-dependent dehydrogenase (short-subunit alcohol dehydrogenase family)
MPVLTEYNLSGRVAILNTAGGAEAPILAQALAEAGAAVFILARRQHLLDAVLATLGGKASGGVVADLTSPAGVTQAMKAFDQQHRRADILVNDSRSFFARPFIEISLEEWDEVHSRNVRATFLLCQEVGQRMIHQRYGRIVNLVSVLAERGMINGSAFSASQAALLSLTRSLGVEWGKHNIRVNALGTGWYSAEEVPLERQQEELLVRYTPLRRKGSPAITALGNQFTWMAASTPILKILSRINGREFQLRPIPANLPGTHSPWCGRCWCLQPVRVEPQPVRGELVEP